MKTGLRYCTILIVAYFFIFSSMAEGAAAGNALFSMFKPTSSINKKVEENINTILRCKNTNSKIPSVSQLAPLLEYMLVVNDDGKRVHPEKRSEGLGMYWSDAIPRPFFEFLRYVYNPDIPSELVYPAALRRGYWMPGSDILSLNKPLWVLAANIDETPVILRGVEREEISPNEYSGCYYSYDQKRLLILLRYKDVPMLLSVSWQDSKSMPGRKGNFLGDYGNWDFVYTDNVGGTASGLGSLTTYIYSSSTITLLYPKDDGTTGCSMFKWIKAGWGGINVVGRQDMIKGTDHNFSGLLQVLDRQRDIKAEELEAINKRYGKAPREEMLREVKPYVEELAKLSKNDEILKRSEFQAVLANGEYPATLSDDELRSLLKGLALKRRMGKFVLGDKI